MKYLAAVLVLILVFLSGFVAREYVYPPEPLVKWKTQVKTDIIYRDYPKVSLPECVEKLRCYDTAMPRLEYKRLDAGTYRIGAGLCEREWSREMSIEVGDSGNWKFYVGIGAGVVATAGAIYLATQVIR